ncbi:hypothetical protein [Prosthecobacter sp.]|uniref:hypothetical protein n=1 Tax=Prosthecobacter sp. TaxID=1965333 RepID=UPI003784E05B
MMMLQAAAPSPPPTSVLGSPIVFAFLLLVLTLVQVVPFWFICRKAGMSPWLSLISMIPLGTLVLTFVLAFAEWPALKRDGQQARF